MEIRHKHIGKVIFTGDKKELARADLSEANLQEADLWRANLQGADLREADLWGANLQEANLRGANLWGAKLQWADLWRANLQGAKLQWADLQWADLSEANLSEANLWRANLWGAKLQWRANLQGAKLEGTCLDPNNKPNAQVSDFLEKDNEFVFGYRTRKTSVPEGHLVDERIYTCEVFSTCDTECHPGWYLWPTKEQVIDFSGNVEIIKVRSRIKDVHKVGIKYRSKEIQVIGTV